ncbi:hypothetical protein BGX34_002122 [Mortierella sp. NVP85]|nr:hypothetical protein BGX34_002122 [Mortierella sp. NVP85]
MPTAITRGIRINETVHFYTSPYPILTPSPSATPDTITNNGSITPPTADAATSGQLPLPLPVLIGVAVGGFVLVVIVLVLLLILIRQRNRDKEDANKVYPDQHSSHGQGYGQIQNDLEKARAMYMEAEKAKQQDAYHDKDQMEERYGGRTIRTDRPHLPRHLPRHDNKAFSMAQSVSSDGGYGTNSEHSGRSRQGRTQQRPMRSSSAGSGAGSAASLTIDTVGRTRESDRRERQAPAPIGPDMYQYHKQQIQQRELEEHYRKQRELQQSRATSSPSSSSPPSMFSESGTLPSSNYSAQPLIHPTEKMSSHSVQSLNASSFPPPPPPPGQPSVAGASDPSQRHPYDRIPVPPVPMIPDAVFSPALSTASSHRFQGYSGSERTASEAYIDLIPVDTANGSASPWMSPWATPALQPSSSRGKGKGKGKGKKVQDAVGESPPVRDTLYDAYDYAFREDAGANDGEIKYL